MASELEGLKKQLNIYVRKLNHLREEYAIASDASIKFSLKMQIQEVEKEIETIRSKIENPDMAQLNAKDEKPPSNEKNLHDSTIDKFKNNRIVVLILIAFAIIVGTATILTSIEDIKNFMGWNSEEEISKENTQVEPPPTTSEPKNTKPPENGGPTSSPNRQVPPKQKPILPQEPQESIEKERVSITFIVDAAFEYAEIWINDEQYYPLADSTPSFKKINLEYNPKGYEVVLKTANKTCTKQFSIAANELNNPITIPVSCTN